MARRGRKNQGQGRKKQQQSQFEEMDKYPVSPPHSFARIVRDLRTLNIIYQVIEPPLNKKETEQKDQIMEIGINDQEWDEDGEADLKGCLEFAGDKSGKQHPHGELLGALQRTDIGQTNEESEVGFPRLCQHELTKGELSTQ